MAGLRIGIDVGGTFTHGVALKPPGEVVATARTPTTHRAERGVAAGVAIVLRELLRRLNELGFAPSDVELVAHSTTQATNALLEGDVAPVTRVVIIPPGEGLLVRSAMRGKRLDVGNGHQIELETQYQNWEAVGGRPSLAAAPVLQVAVPADMMDKGVQAEPPAPPVAVIQPLAGGHELREQAAAEQLRAAGRQVVCASDITQVLGLAARARTAVVNASMLPKMLATAEFTEAAVHEVLGQGGSQKAEGRSEEAAKESDFSLPTSDFRLPLLQVVRSDGGAMSIDEMRRQPVLSLLSGPAAGASAALHLSGLSEVVFIEVGGTSTDITLISEGRVRHRYATVGGQRLMVPALDLRTVAVGGGSMLRADRPLFGPRSAHIAGLPYLFQALADGRKAIGYTTWTDENDGTLYVAARLNDGGLAPFTLTDCYFILNEPAAAGKSLSIEIDDNLQQELIKTLIECAGHIEFGLPRAFWQSRRAIRKRIRGTQYADARSQDPYLVGRIQYKTHNVLLASAAYENTCKSILQEIRSLARSHSVNIDHSTLVGGGGGAPVVLEMVSSLMSFEAGRTKLIPHHAVISAIGAALAVTCVSLSKSVAEPGAGEIAELVAAVEQKLSTQGAERVSTDYEYDPQRQVLTVTGRGNRPYEQSATPKSAEELARVAEGFIDNGGLKVWDGGDVQLWQASADATRQRAGRLRSAARLGLALDRFGRSLWLGQLTEFFAAPAGQREAQLKQILDTRTQYTDGGPLLPGLALLCAGRFIPLDQLGSAELIADILRFESLPADAAGCFIIRG